MPDTEKVINKVTAIVADMQEEVDEWKDYSDSELRCGLTCDCDWWYKTLQTLNDALALLKVQEPIAPVENAGFYYCGACKCAFTVHRQKYCSDCGREVKWE